MFARERHKNICGFLTPQHQPFSYFTEQLLKCQTPRLFTHKPAPQSIYSGSLDEGPPWGPSSPPKEACMGRCSNSRGGGDPIQACQGPLDTELLLTGTSDPGLAWISWPPHRCPRPTRANAQRGGEGGGDRIAQNQVRLSAHGAVDCELLWGGGWLRHPLLLISICPKPITYSTEYPRSSPAGGWGSARSIRGCQTASSIL